MPDDTILCWTSSLTTSGHVTVADYKAWQAQGDRGRQKIAEFFRARIRERYVEPVLALGPDQKNGFSIMALSCLLIETYETFRQGWPSSDNKSAAHSPSVVSSTEKTYSTTSRDLPNNSIRTFGAAYFTKGKPPEDGILLEKMEDPFSILSRGPFMRPNSTTSFRT
jgi:hypothetical protein